MKDRSVSPVTAPVDGSGPSVAVDRWRPRVFEFLEQHSGEIVTDLSELVRLPSISGSDEESSIQSVLARRLNTIGLDVDHWAIPLPEHLSAPDFPGVEVDRREAWGLVGLVHGAGDGPSLMLNAHVDVVPPGDLAAWGDADPFSGEIGSDVVRGRGTCDMKGGLVAALWAVRVLNAVGVPLRGDLALACVPGEEDGGLGTYATLARGWRADACIIPEPTALDVVPANGGSLTFRLRVRGRAAHASRRTSGVSAIEKFGPVLAALRRLETERNRVTDPLMARWDIAYPIEVGVVRSGDWSSSVPDLLVAQGRYGIALDESLDRARRQFVEALAAAGSADAWLRDHPVEVEWWGGQFGPGRTDVDSAIVQTVLRAHSGAVAHRPPTRPQQIWGVPYGSDLRLMTGQGIPTVHYGPGDLALAHSPREVVPVADVLTTARTLALAAMHHCGVG